MSLRYLLDECCPLLAAELLNRQGVDCSTVAHDHSGATDDEVAMIAVAENGILITGDVEFAERVARGEVAVPGLILGRLRRSPPELRSERLCAAAQAFGASAQGALVIVRMDRWRSPSLPHP